MKFSYIKFPLPQKSDLYGSSILRPVIPIRIGVGKQSLQYEALIDSGADFCVFDAEVGEALGLVIRGGRELQFGGVQGSSKSSAYLHDVVISIGGHDHQTRVAFSSDISKRGYGILGQRGFFDLFVVKFDLLKEQIELNRRSE